MLLLLLGEVQDHVTVFQSPSFVPRHSKVKAESKAFSAFEFVGIEVGIANSRITSSSWLSIHSMVLTLTD